MNAPTVSESLVQTLARMGVRHVFGVVGDALNSFTDALRREGTLRWIGVRHEEVAALAAGAQAELQDGQLGVCAASIGPGAIHLLNGLYDAQQSEAPVLAIAGQVALSEIGSSYSQEVDVELLFRDVSVYRQTIVSPEQMPRIAQLAIQAALSDRGVASLFLPADMGSRTVANGAHDIFVADSETLPAPAEIERVSALLNSSGRIAILAGHGCRGARRELFDVANRLKAPIAYTLPAKDGLEHDNPYSVGMAGAIGSPAAVHALEACDAVLLVGTDFPYRDYYPTGKKVIQIDLRADRLGRRCRIDLGVVGHARATLMALLPLLSTRDDARYLDSVTDEFRQWKRSLFERAAANAARPPIRAAAVAAAVNDLAAEDAIFTVDTGMSVVWAARYLTMKAAQRLIGSFHFGTMGNAMPQAIGAQALYPRRQVISLSGDGGFSMLAGDLMTAVSHNLPIKVIVFNNSRFGAVKLEMESGGMPEFGTLLQNPSFAKVAESMGALGIRVTEPLELRPALQQAFEAKGPAVVDVVTDPNEVADLAKPGNDKVRGFTLEKLKGMWRRTENR